MLSPYLDDATLQTKIEAASQMADSIRNTINILQQLGELYTNVRDNHQNSRQPDGHTIEDNVIRASFGDHWVEHPDDI